MVRERNVPTFTSLDNPDFVRCLRNNVSGKIDVEDLKSEIAAGDKLVNGFYYFQDAANPQNGDWRLNTTNSPYLDFERYDSALQEPWEQIFRVGGSATTERFYEIRMLGGADLIVSNENHHFLFLLSIFRQCLLV